MNKEITCHKCKKSPDCGLSLEQRNMRRDIDYFFENKDNWGAENAIDVPGYIFACDKWGYNE